MTIFMSLSRFFILFTFSFHHFHFDISLSFIHRFGLVRSIIILFNLKDSFFSVKKIKCRYWISPIHSEMQKICIFPIPATLNQRIRLAICQQIICENDNTKDKIRDNFICQYILFIEIISLSLNLNDKSSNPKACAINEYRNGCICHKL